MTRLKRFWAKSTGNRKLLSTSIVVLFAVAGVVAIILTKAASSSTNLSQQPESGTLSGGAYTCSLAGASGSGSNCLRFGYGDPAPGIRNSFGANSLVNNEFVTGGQIVFNWPQIEPAKDTFCWNNPRQTVTKNGVQVTIGCGTSTDNSSRGLGKQLEYFANIGKNVTVQVNSDQKPDWVYTSGVEKCGTEARQLDLGGPAYDIPKYWDDDGTTNDAYMAIMQAMISSFATTMRADPHKAAIAGIRTSPNLIGTEFYAADPNRSSGNEGKITITNNDCLNWTYDEGYLAYATVIKMYYDTLEPDIRPILRQEAFGFRAHSLDENTYLLAKPGKLQPWFFLTDSNPDHVRSSQQTFIEQWAKSGKAISYAEAVMKSSKFQNPVSWNYWNILGNLDRNTSIIPMFGEDIDKGRTNPEYRAAYDFANLYAGYNQPDKADNSPGAWIALAPKSGEITRALTGGNFAMFMTEDSDGSQPVDSLGSFPSGCYDDGSQTSCAGVDPIGDSTQRFGRWARKAPSGHGILLSLDSSFRSSLNGTVQAYVTYLNCGGGSWKLDWGNGSSTSVTKDTGACGQDSRWVTSSAINVPSNQIKGSFSGSDFGLSSTGGDTIFHMLEIRR